MVMVEAGTLLDQLAVVLEAVGTHDGRSILRQDFVVPINNSAQWTDELAGFTEGLRSSLALPPATLTASRVLPSSMPQPFPQYAPLLPPGRGGLLTRPRRALLYVAGGSALVSAGASVALGLGGLKEKSRLYGARYAEPLTGREASRLSFNEAQRSAERANTRLTASLLTAALSATLTAATAYLWAEDKRSLKLSQSADGQH
jgi:hypothetical protein